MSFEPLPTDLEQGVEQYAEQWHVSHDEAVLIVPTLEDYLHAGVVRGVARRQGRQIALDDCLIGTTAVRLGLPVSTGNTEHFLEMQRAGLAVEIENWRDE
jgi:predicted nucleic acid-binding protein